MTRAGGSLPTATDTLERHNAAHRARAVRAWTDPGGTWHLHANGTPTDGRPDHGPPQHRDRADLQGSPRAANARESVDAYRFDALLRIAESTGGTAAKARPHLFVNVDAEKLTGGDDTAGRCEIKGVGPVPVETARELMGDALLTILVKKGVDVTTIAHDGSQDHARRACDARCWPVIPNVSSRSAPPRHVRCITCTWRSDGGEHSTTNCVGVCSWCHDLVHYHHYTLQPNGDGTYHLRAPPE